MKNEETAAKAVSVPATVEMPGHALDEVEIIPSKRSWAKRVKEWNRPMSFERRESWLHENTCCFEDCVGAFTFFMRIADGYGLYPDDFAQGKGTRDFIYTLTDYDSIATLKCRLAQKAFTILCNGYFKEEEPNYPHIVPYQEPVMSYRFWFFREHQAGGYSNLRPGRFGSLGKDGGRHYLEVAVNFAKRFATNCWEILNGHNMSWSEKPDEVVSRAHLFQVVDLMARLDLLDLWQKEQFLPKPPVFVKLVANVTGETNPEVLCHGEKVGNLLEPKVREGDEMASALYLARLRIHY